MSIPPFTNRFPGRRRWLGLMLALVMSMMVAACAGEDPATTAEETPAGGQSNGGQDETAGDLAPIRFGYQSSLWGAPLILADITGRWEEAGLDVTSQRFSAGADVRDAILGGSVDAGSIGSAPFVVAAAAGELYAIAPAGYLGETVAVVVGADSDIETVEDLAGKSVASRSGSITELVFFNEVLPEHGMSEEDIQPRNVTFADQVAALSTGEVDAFVGLEPYVSIAVAEGIGRRLINFGEFDVLPNIFAVRRDFADENEETVIAALRSYFETTEWMVEDFDEAAAALHEDFLDAGLELDEETLAEALEAVDVDPVIDDEFRAYLEDQAELLMEEGRIQSLPNWDEVLRTDLQEEAMTDYWAERQSDS